MGDADVVGADGEPAVPCDRAASSAARSVSATKPWSLRSHHDREVLTVLVTGGRAGLSAASGITITATGPINQSSNDSQARATGPQRI